MKCEFQRPPLVGQLVLACVLFTGVCHLRAEIKSEMYFAIVSDDSVMAHEVVDFLTLELSNAGFDLVERQRIEQLLRE